MLSPSTSTAFQSTPSTRRETCNSIFPVHSRENFNPLPPHGGRRDLQRVSMTALVFQSTPSTRRETVVKSGTMSPLQYFNPLPPHGGRRIEWVAAFLCGDFNPLPPHGGRLYYNSPLPSGEDISIHSLHTEGDRIPGSHLHNRCNFNPLPPHGGRPADELQQWGERVFQSTPSTRRETSLIHTIRNKPFISIHSLHTEGDHTDSDDAGNEKAFQSTPSTRRETQEEADRQGITLFQSTPSTRRETCFIAWSGICKFYFNPLPPHGGRLRSMIIPSFQKSISIHSLHTEGDTR